MIKLVVAIGLLIFSYQSYSHEFVIGINERDIYRVKNDNGQWTGKDIELIKAIFKKTPHSFKIIAMPWPRVLKELESGAIDMTFAAAISAERQAYALFSQHIFRYSYYMLFVHKNKLNLFESVTKLEDISNTNVLIGALRGAIYSDSYNALLNKKSFTNKLAFIGNDQSMPSFVLKGRVDGYIESEIEGKHYLLQQPNYNKNIVPLFRITTEQEATSRLMFSKKTVTQTQVDTFDVALKTLHDSGEYQQIAKKYTLASEDVY